MAEEWNDTGQTQLLMSIHDSCWLSVMTFIHFHHLSVDRDHGAIWESWLTVGVRGAGVRRERGGCTRILMCLCSFKPTWIYSIFTIIRNLNKMVSCFEQKKIFINQIIIECYSVSNSTQSKLTRNTDYFTSSINGCVHNKFEFVMCLYTYI